MASETPLTDAQAGSDHAYWGWDYDPAGLYVSADFARTLEMRVAALEHALRAIVKLDDEYLPDLSNYQDEFNAARALLGEKR